MPILCLPPVTNLDYIPTIEACWYCNEYYGFTIESTTNYLFGMIRTTIEGFCAYYGETLSEARRLYLVDLDGSGYFNNGDIFTFIEYYFSGNYQVDINRDGEITVQDLFTFLQYFFQGD